MIRMELRQLEVMAAVADAGGFTRAAHELHLVQSAVSATVAALERELGTPLFDRTTRRVTLTPAGHALLPHAHRLLRAAQEARDAVDGVTGGVSGTLRIGYMTNVTLFDIPELLGRFSSAHPAVALHLAPAATGTAGLAEGLRSGAVDIAFLSGTQEEYPDLEVTLLAQSRLGLGVPAAHELAGRKAIRVAETVGLRFVDFREGFATRTAVDRLFRERGLPRDVQIETSDTNDTAALVRNGLGVAFLPEYLVADDPAIAWIPLRDASFSMRVSVATPRGRTPSAAAARLAALARANAEAPAT